MQIIAVSLNSVVITPSVRQGFIRRLHAVMQFQFRQVPSLLSCTPSNGRYPLVAGHEKTAWHLCRRFPISYGSKGSRTNDRNPYNCWRSTTTYIALAYPANNARPLRPSTTTRKSLLCVWLRHALFARGDGRITQGVDDPGLACWCREPAKEEENWISTVQAYRRNRRHYSLNPSFFLHLKRRPKDVSCRCVKIYLRL